jgi:uncharacterized membrane protein YciS (DUF1049 family)
MMAVASTLFVIGIIAGWLAWFFYFLSCEQTDKMRRRQERADEFAQAQRRITHNKI